MGRYDRTGDDAAWGETCLEGPVASLGQLPQHLPQPRYIKDRGVWILTIGNGLKNKPVLVEEFLQEISGPAGGEGGVAVCGNTPPFFPRLPCTDPNGEGAEQDGPVKDDRRMLQRA